MSPVQQLTLDIAHPPSYAREDFVVGQNNAEALALAERLAWPTPLAVIVGAPRSGKTHLAHIFAQRLGPVAWYEGAIPSIMAETAGVIVDGLQRWLGTDEDSLFHTLEAARAARLPVLVTSETPPETLGLQRPDTLSRLRAGERATITDPDDAAFTAIAIKLFTDRQLLVDPAIASYLLQRMERSYSNLANLIALIDERSLAAGRSITKPLAREVLEAYELSHS